MDNNRTNRDLYEHIKGLMSHGLVEHTSGRKYYTGYSYGTLYDWDQYFEGIVQLYMGYGTQYLQNCVTIFLDAQQENGFISPICPQCTPKRLSSNGRRDGKTVSGADHPALSEV